MSDKMSDKNVSGSTCDKCGAELVMGDKTPCYCQAKKAPKAIKPNCDS